MKKFSTEKYGKWLKLAMLTVGIGSIYKLAYISDVFYVPLQETLNLSNSQVALTLTVYSVAQTFAYIFSTYVADRVSSRILVGGSLIVTGLCGFYFATFPSFSMLLIIWAIWGTFCEGMYWPSLARAVRLLGTEKEQGRLFGILAGGRGVIDTVVAFTGLSLFAWFGSGATGFSLTIIFYSCWDVSIGLLTLLFLNIEEKSSEEQSEHVTLQDTIQVLKQKEVWLISFIVFFAYCSMVATSYFNPYLVKVFSISTTLAGIYGIIVAYVLRIGAGPLGGFLVDFTFKGKATTFIMLAFAINIAAALVLYILPKTSSFIWITLFATVVFSFMMLAMRATYTVLCEEAKLPRKTMGAAVSVACLIGFTPTLFGYPLFGFLLDSFANEGFNYIWLITAGCMLCGLLVSLWLKICIKRQQIATEPVDNI